MSAIPSTTSWEELREKLLPYVRRRVATAEDAEDVLQDVLLRVHEGVSDLDDDERFAPWLYRVARNAVIDHGRGRARRRRVETNAGEMASAPDLSSAEPWLAAERAEREGESTGARGACATPLEAIDDADVVAIEARLASSLRLFVHLLPEPYREAIELTEIEGLTQREAALRLGISVSGMKSRVQRGRAKLRAMLESCCAIALDRRNQVVACEPRPLDEALSRGCCGGKAASPR